VLYATAKAKQKDVNWGISYKEDAPRRLLQLNLIFFETV